MFDKIVLFIEAIIRDGEVKAKSRWPNTPSLLTQSLLEKFLLSEQRVLLVKGAAFSGKTQSCYHLIRKLLKEHLDKPIFPIFISLARYQEPDCNLINTSLQNDYKLSKEQIATLRSEQVVFIFDGYEDLSEFYNLYVRCNLSSWPNAKIIITSRTLPLAFLGNDHTLFAPFRDERPCYSELQVVNVPLLSLKQVSDYLRERSLYNKKSYAIQDLLQHPFFLMNYIEMAPNLAQTTTLVLKKLLHVWFSAHKEKINSLKLSKHDCDYSTETLRYCHDLAKLMSAQGITKVSLQPKSNFFVSSNDSEKSQCIDLNNPRIRLVYSMLPGFVSESSKIGFFAKCLISYFANLAIERDSFDVVVKKSDEVSQVQKFLPLTDHPLNTALLIDKREEIGLLADSVLRGAKDSHRIRNVLFHFVFASKNCPALAIAAANAITTLNHAKVSFSRVDFSGINIPWADLSGGIFDGTDFTESDLRGANFSHAWLCGVKLNSANLIDVKWGEWPKTKFKGEIKVIYRDEHKLLKVISVEQKFIHIWNSAGQLLRTLKGHEKEVSCIAVSPEGQYLVSGGKDQKLRLWSMKTYECDEVLLGHTSSVVGINFSPCGQQFVSLSQKGMVLLWSITTRTHEHIQVNPLNTYRAGLFASGMIASPAFNSKGKQLAIGGSDGKIHIWRIATQTSDKILAGHRGEYFENIGGYGSAAITSLVYSANGQKLASGSEDTTVCLWSILDYACEAVLRGHSGAVSCLMYSKNDLHLVSGSKDNTVRVWSTLSYVCQAVFSVNTGTINCLMSSNGKQNLVMSGSTDGTMYTWSVTDYPLESMRLSGHQNDIAHLRFIESGQKLVSGSWDREMRVWSISAFAREAIQSFDAIRGSFIFSPDGQLLAKGCIDGRVLLWSVLNGKRQSDLSASHGPTYCFTFSNDSQQLAFMKHKVIYVFLLSNHERKAKLHGHTKKITCLSYSPNDQQLASGSEDKTIRLWSLSGRPVQATLSKHTSTVTCLSYSPNGQHLASGSEDNTVRIWSTSGYVQKGILLGHIGTVMCISYNSVNDQQLVSGSKDKTVRLWCTQTYTCLGLLKIQGEILDMQWLKNQLAISYGKTILLWQTPVSKNINSWCLLKRITRTPLLQCKFLQFAGAKVNNEMSRLLVEKGADDPEQAVPQNLLSFHK